MLFRIRSPRVHPSRPRTSPDLSTVHPVTPKKRRVLVLGLGIPTLLLAGCGTENDPGEGPVTDAVADPDVSGSIVISGSSTVEPVTALVREDFIDQNDNVDIDVDGPGTGDGFELFCQGDVDMTNASRPIQAPEIEDCEADGIEFIELIVGIDGLSVVVNPDNALECLSFQDLYALVGPESEGFENWADASDLAREMGSDTEFPDENLVVTAPGAESGTYDSFVEIVIEGAGESRVESGNISEDAVASARADYSAQSDDNTIIEGAINDRGGLGWAGFAFADRAEGVKSLAISVEPGGDCVDPAAAAIQDGSYPISRNLYVYVNKAEAEQNDALSAFVDFYLSGLTGFVEASDYVALGDPSDTIDTWESRTAGRQEVDQ